MKRTTGYRRRADVNHGAIKTAFLEMGCSVTDLRLVGKALDLLVGYRGVDRQIEVKRPKGAVKPSQTAYINTWKGARPAIVRTVDDVQQLVSQWAETTGGRT